MTCRGSRLHTSSVPAPADLIEPGAAQEGANSRRRDSPRSSARFGGPMDVTKEPGAEDSVVVRADRGRPSSGGGFFCSWQLFAVIAVIINRRGSTGRAGGTTSVARSAQTPSLAENQRLPTNSVREASETEVAAPTLGVSWEASGRTGERPPWRCLVIRCAQTNTRPYDAPGGCAQLDKRDARGAILMAQR